MLFCHQGRQLRVSSGAHIEWSKADERRGRPAIMFSTGRDRVTLNGMQPAICRDNLLTDVRSGLLPFVSPFLILTARNVHRPWVDVIEEQSDIILPRITSFGFGLRHSAPM